MITLQDVAIFLGLMALSCSVGALAAVLTGGVPLTGLYSGGVVCLTGIAGYKIIGIQ